MNITATYITSPGGTYYAFPASGDLDDWLDDRVLLTEGSGANAGKYTATLDSDVDLTWIVFSGGSQPTWDDAVDSLKLSTIEAELAAIRVKTEQIGTGSALAYSPYADSGDLFELVIGDDYLAANGRALEWTFDEITGITTSATGSFGIKDASTGLEVYVNTTGVVTEPTAGTFKVSFDIPKTALDDLSPGEYNWSVQVVEGSVEITIAKNRQNKTRVRLVEKQT